MLLALPTELFDHLDLFLYDSQRASLACTCRELAQRQIDFQPIFQLSWRASFFFPPNVAYAWLLVSVSKQINDGSLHGTPLGHVPRGVLLAELFRNHVEVADP